MQDDDFIPTPIPWFPLLSIEKAADIEALSLELDRLISPLIQFEDDPLAWPWSRVHAEATYQEECHEVSSLALDYGLDFAKAYASYLIEWFTARNRNTLIEDIMDPESDLGSAHQFVVFCFRTIGPYVKTGALPPAPELGDLMGDSWIYR
jgi:hypothetical protein